MTNECSTLNPDCIVKKGTPCPALESGKNCWEFDWMPLIKKMEKEDQGKWKAYMEEKCPKCPAFRDPMKEMIARIQQEIA